MSQIINIKYEKMEEFARVQERLMAFCRLEDRINILLDNGNLIFQSQVLHSTIVKKYFKDHKIELLDDSMKEEALRRFINSLKTIRPSIVEYFQTPQETTKEEFAEMLVDSFSNIKEGTLELAEEKGEQIIKGRNFEGILIPILKIKGGEK